MSFETYVNIIANIINKLIVLISKVYETLIYNNIFKTIIFIILITIIIEYFNEIIDFIKNIFSMKKSEGKNKVKSNTDIE